MSKGILVEEVERRGLPRGEAEKAVDAVFDALSAVAERGDRVTIRGFGRFEMKNRKGRVGRHPVSGAAMNIPAKRVLVFSQPKGN